MVLDALKCTTTGVSHAVNASVTDPGHITTPEPDEENAGCNRRGPCENVHLCSPHTVVSLTSTRHTQWRSSTEESHNHLKIACVLSMPTDYSRIPTRPPDIRDLIRGRYDSTSTTYSVAGVRHA